MKKKAYQAPLMRVKIVQQTEMICESLTEANSSQNEAYEEVDSYDTSYWFGSY